MKDARPSDAPTGADPTVATTTPSSAVADGPAETVQELQEFVNRELTVGYHARMDHYFWCGVVDVYESCIRREEHDAEGVKMYESMKRKGFLA